MRTDTPPTRTSDGDVTLGVVRAAVAGALAGAIGGLALLATTKGEEKVLLPPGEQAVPGGAQAVERLADARGQELSDTQVAAAGAGLQLGYCAIWGAIYGVVHSRLRPPAVLHAPLLGGLSYATAYGPSGILPRLGVVPPPAEQSIERAAVPIGAHLAFGVTTAAVFEALQG